jgi:hypothetical protein
LIGLKLATGEVVPRAFEPWRSLYLLVRPGYGELRTNTTNQRLPKESITNKLDRTTNFATLMPPRYGPREAIVSSREKAAVARREMIVLN